MFALSLGIKPPVGSRVTYAKAVAYIRPRDLLLTSFRDQGSGFGFNQRCERPERPDPIQRCSSELAEAHEHLLQRHLSNFVYFWFGTVFQFNKAD